MATYATFYLSRAQKFEVKAMTDEERSEVKLEIKTVFDNITICVSKEQAGLLKEALAKEVEDVPF